MEDQNSQNGEIRRTFSPIYKNHEFEALVLQYQTQTSLLRTITDIDLKIFTGYITLQLFFGGWLIQFPICNMGLKIGLCIIDLALVGVAIWLINKSYQRRTEVANNVKRLNEALGYTTKGVYLKKKKLNAESEYRPWRCGYFVGLITAAIGVILIIFL